MKNKLKYSLTFAALTFLVGCSDKGSIQRPSIGSGPIVELSNYQYYPLPDKTWAIAVGNNKYLEKLTLPEQYQGQKVTQIAENGFKDCRALREISIPSSVLTIGDYAFEECPSLKGIAIPEGVTTIGDSAFYGCTSLISAVIPEGVTAIGDRAFDASSRLTVYCQARSEPSGWEVYWKGSGCPVVWGCIRVGNQDCFEYAVTNIEGVESATITVYTGSDTSITVPETIGGVKVTAIADSAFYGCTSLTSIAIPEGVTSIGNSAFVGCASLASIVIPNSVTNIGDGTFKGCASLTSIVIPERVTTIGDEAFEGCSSLTSIVIPDGVTTIGYYTFNCCTSLISVVIPDGVTTIGYRAFDCCTSLTSVVIPNSVMAIGGYAFDCCTSLTSVVIPEGVISIGAYAFYDCSSLTIYCQAQSEPSGWSSGWNESGCPVVWGYSGNGTSGSLNYRIDNKNGEGSI